MSKYLLALVTTLVLLLSGCGTTDYHKKYSPDGVALVGSAAPISDNFGIFDLRSNYSWYPHHHHHHYHLYYFSGLGDDYLVFDDWDSDADYWSYTYYDWSCWPYTYGWASPFYWPYSYPGSWENRERFSWREREWRGQREWREHHWERWELNRNFSPPLVRNPIRVPPAIVVKPGPQPFQPRPQPIRNAPPTPNPPRPPIIHREPRPQPRPQPQPQPRPAPPVHHHHR